MEYIKRYHDWVRAHGNVLSVVETGEHAWKLFGNLDSVVGIKDSYVNSILYGTVSQPIVVNYRTFVLDLVGP